MDEFVYSAMPTKTIEVKGEKFDMVNLCLKSSTRNQMPRLYWCAASRVVTEENITGKVPRALRPTLGREGRGLHLRLLPRLRLPRRQRPR